MNHQSQSESHRSFHLSRRHFLRGLGACVALPAFTSAPTRLFAAESATTPLATTARGAPLRTAFVYFPNGAIPAQWWPNGDETNFELHGTLSPLESARQHIQVLGGLNHENANPGPDGAGDHARANGTFLTGVRMKKSAADIRAGISIDQVIAQKIGHLTRFPSLELTCDNVRRSGACDSGYACAYQFNLSWSSATTPMAPEGNPRLIFERLFGTGNHGERNASLQRRQQEQRSILDFVMEDARAMQRRLDHSDKAKLDQYLTGIREIETRIEKAERFGKAPDPAIDTPAGVPTSYEQYVNLMFDMLVLAFQTDSTRVATFLLAHDGSNRPFGEIGVFEGHHDLSHHQNREDWVGKVAQIDQWYARQFAKFLKKMEDTKDVDGNSLLRNSQIVYGSGNADGNRHTHTNLPLILAGGGGGTLTPGRYVKHNSRPASNLFLTMSDRLGVQGLERFGDSSGRLTNV
ncbi:MAG: DUF1552 domain-containing protein [Limisphaerales bacterium]